MTPRWHDGPLTALAPGDGPVVWSVALVGDAAALALEATPAMTDDLADVASAKDGASRLHRRRLARALLARMADLSPDDVRLSRSRHGAPVVDRPTGWHVSLSGRDGDCLIGAGRQPIGVDREALDDHEPLRDMLTPAEIAAHDRLPAVDGARDWLRRWTIKEAHAKLIGEPLRIAPETIDTRIEGADVATATFEGVSHCWTRQTASAIETVAIWS